MSKQSAYVLGIGASAGGLEAIQEFFNYMPKTDKLTFIIAQHLSPDFKSMMSELLAQNTTMPIIMAKNKMKLNAGAIYLVPATYEAKIENHHFVLTKLIRNELSLPINTLFQSLAISYKEFAIGIILSGTGSDGALGMQEIAKKNGLTIVESPTEAKFSDMPNNAIATKEINCVLSISEMPDLIIDYLSNPALFNKNYKQIEPINKSQYHEIFNLMEKQYKINFASYKIATIARRIQRRMQLLGIDSLQMYIDYLITDSDARRILYQDLLIGVTEFFRDPKAFFVLKNEVIPELFKKIKDSDEVIRIWINPCATGEEAYTIAILLKEYVEENNLPFSLVKIFASDVFLEFIQTAKKGRYSYKSVEHIPSSLLNKYFIKTSDYYEVIPEIKNQILFTTHNLLSEQHFTKMDLISCRNFLIYITPKEQKRVTDLLRFSLNIGGYLFLGPSEGLLSLEPDLIVINQLWRIFKKIKKSNLPIILNSSLIDPLTKTKGSTVVNNVMFGTLPLYVYNAILHDVISAGFILDPEFVVLHTIGKAREMVVLPEGVPSLILPKIILDELKGALIAALYQAKNKLMPVVCDNLIINLHEKNQSRLKMSVHPLCDKTNQISYYWIRFDPVKVKTKKTEQLVINGFQSDPYHDEIIINLERELAETRALLQSALENKESVNEEMQSTNEELMASNEELQSTNEELQSVNEELYTVNLERSNKIEEVIQTKADIDNLIRGAEICTIILNSKLEIRIFTPAIEKIFNLVSHDIGRPLKNFRHNLNIEHFMEKVEDVLKNNKPYEIELKNNQGHWYYLKIVPYHSTNDKLATGVVITLTDINETKQLQQKKEAVEKDLRVALKTGLIGVWHVNLLDQHFSYDETIKSILNLEDLSSINQLKEFLVRVHLEDRKRIEKALRDTMAHKEGFEQTFRIVRPDHSIRHISCSANIHEDHDSSYITGICWDLTEQYWLDEKIIDAQHLNLGLDAVTDGWWDWDLTNNKTFLSPLLKKTLGYEDYEIVNRKESYEQLMLPQDLKTLRAKIEKYCKSNSTLPMVEKLRMRHKSGKIIWILSRTKGIINKNGKLIRMIGTITDITALKETEASLEQLAYRDLLTQIPNRRSFLDALVIAIERAKRNANMFAVMFIDIDDFKDINDKWGHNTGDLVLCEFTKRILCYSRTVDLFARLGGDEFGIILEDVVNKEEVSLIASRYISAFSAPLKIKNLDIFITISIGVAIYPLHEKTEKQLLQHADTNMYLAKNNGKNQFIV